MIKKLICILGFIIIFTSYACAMDVSFGIEGGYSYNMLNTSTGYRLYTSYENRAGFLIGVPVLVHFSKQFALGSGLRYVQKNYRYQRTLLGEHLLYSDFTNGFLQVPLFLDFSLGKNNWRIFFDIGATLGFWLRSSRKGEWMGFSENPYDPDYIQIEQFNERIKFDNRRDNRFESALFAGVGFRYTLKSFTPFISAQLHYGLTDLQKNYMLNQVSRYNNTITVQMGILFNSSLFGEAR